MAEGGTNSNIIFDYNFGGFTDSICENYKVEVLSAGHNGFVRPINGYMYMVCDGLADSGYFLRKRLSASQCVLAVLPTAALGDSYLQRSGSCGISFVAKNARTRKRITI